MPKPLAWRLFQDVVVPAVLGNSLWAFLFLLAANDWHATTPARLSVLAALSVFLLKDWTGGDGDPALLAGKSGLRLWLRYVLPTSLFYLAIAGAAIQVGTINRHAYFPMAGLFLVTAIGQFLGVWMRVATENEAVASARLRYLHGIANLIAAVVIIVALSRQSLLLFGTFEPCHNANDPTPHWVAFGAISIATLPWLFGKRLEKYLTPKATPDMAP
jgi:hypothetical protein